ncbi:type IV pilin protein [Patescibacteria group bacterium]|nr:type IV pilin protein [Patescibacteria group bacterium]
MMNFRKKLQKFGGFTLLEILVVISIIGILIAIGSAAFTTAQKKGRDARRRADMKQYQNAFEQYYSENDAYNSCTNMEAGFVGGPPADPKPGGTAYSCTVSALNAGYCVCATLDFTTTGNASGGGAGVCTFVANSTKFCVQNLQ